MMLHGQFAIRLLNVGTSLWNVLVFVTATPKYSNSYHQKYCRKTKGQWIAVIFKTLHVSCQIKNLTSSLFIMQVALGVTKTKALEI